MRLASLFFCAIPVYAADVPFNSASISGLGARNGSAAMSGLLHRGNARAIGQNHVVCGCSQWRRLEIR